MATLSLTLAGNSDCKAGSSALIWPTVSMMLALVWRLITSSTALSSLKKPLL